MNVSYIMTRNPLHAHPEMSIHDARTMMKKEKVGRLPVLDKGNKLIGIVTESDLINASPSAATTLDIYEMSNLLSKLRIENVMTKNVITIGEDVVVEEAARIMVDADISALPVMRGDTLVGIVSDGDLFKLFIKLFGAREIGVRLTMLVAERPGELHRLSEAIEKTGGNIISLVICDGSDVSNKMCILKVTDVRKDELLAAVRPIAIEMVDIR